MLLRFVVPLSMYVCMYEHVRGCTTYCMHIYTVWNKKKNSLADCFGGNKQIINQLINQLINQSINNNKLVGLRGYCIALKYDIY